MDFRDTPEEAAFRAEVRAFLDAHARRKPEEEEGSLILFSDGPEDPEALERAKAWQKTLYEHGWAVITWPKQYGGRDATPVQAYIFGQELSRYDVPPNDIYLVGHGMIGPTMIAHGTPEQKERYLPKLAEGSEIWCQLWSEPGAGSDLASLQTRGERVPGGSDWVLNGQKVWTTGAHIADYGLIICRTDPDVPKHRGLSVFIVDMHAPGVTVRPLRQMTGGADFNEVFLDDVRVPAENLVGEVNDGWRVALTTLMNERYAVGMSGFGGGMVAPLVRLARRTVLHGGRAIDDPRVRQAVAAAWIKDKLLTLTGYRSLTRLERGGIPGPEGSIMKLVRTHLISEIAEVGTGILGLSGILWGSRGPEEGRWALNVVGAIGSRIGGGTDDIMRNIIGERVLGLPKEPEVDRDVPFRQLRAAGRGR